MRSMSMCWPAPCSTLSPKHRSKEIGRRGAPMALPSFSGAGAKLSAVMQTIVRAQAKLQQATLRTEAGQRRHDSREWVMRRKERTRHLIELGGLVQKAGLVDLTRSEEHTSELQSLMRISYAVFCLKKKNITNRTTVQRQT